MSLDTTILTTALQLDAVDRAELARRLLLSLETSDFDPDADQAWAEEIELRAERADSAKGTLPNWRDAIERARNSLGHDSKQ